LVSSVPSEIENLVLTTFFETVMFSFNAVNDIDLDSYVYELYDNELGEGTPIQTGRNKANVFTVSVENSSLSIPPGEVGIYTPSLYWGRVAVVNSAGIFGSFTELVGGQPTPLVGDQYLDTLTASKITAGTIGAHTITLAGANSIIKSSNYNPSTPIESRQGWFIDGQGNAEFSSAAIRGTISAQSIYLNDNNRWGRNNTNTVDSKEFKVGTDTSYLFYDIANGKVVFTGELLAASGSFSGNISAATGTFTGNLKIGSGESVFKADSNGICLGSETFASAEFRVTPAGELTATSANIVGTVSSSNLTATGGTIAGWTISPNIIEATATTKIQLVKSVPAFPTFYENEFYWKRPAIAIFDGVNAAAIGYIGSYSTSAISFEGKTGDTYFTIDQDGLDSIELIVQKSSTSALTGIHLSTYSNANPGEGVQGVWLDGYAGSSTRDLQVNSDGRIIAVSLSDVSLKENIEPLENTLDKINKLNPVTFYWKDKYERGTDQETGLVAQDVEKVFPNLVGIDSSNDKKTFNSRPLVFIIIKAIQELSQKVENIEKGMTNE
jgi:hypothetical protein